MLNSKLGFKAADKGAGGFYKTSDDNRMSAAIDAAHSVVDKLELSSALFGNAPKAEPAPTPMYSKPAEPQGNAAGMNFANPASISPATAPAPTITQAPQEPMAEPPAPAMPEVSNVAEEPATVSRITRDTTINGSVISETDIEINGTVMGDVESKMSVKLHGKVYGNISSRDAMLEGAAVSGNIHSEGKLTIYGGTYLLGDIHARDTEIDGKIKGNVSSTEKIIIKTGAYIIGDISSKNISVEPGAVVQGRINIDTPVTDSDIVDMFDELKKQTKDSGKKESPKKVEVKANVPAEAKVEVKEEKIEKTEKLEEPKPKDDILTLEIDESFDETENEENILDVKLPALSDSEEETTEESTETGEPKTKLRSALADLKKRTK